MFSSVTSLNIETQDNLKSFNKKIDEGEQAILDTNDNVRTDEIIDNIETLQNSINGIYDSITTINNSITSLENDISYSRMLRQQEIAAGNTDDGEISIRDIIGE